MFYLFPLDHGLVLIYWGPWGMVLQTTAMLQEEQGHQDLGKGHLFELLVVFY